ncbi:MAG TPA: sulfotransferase [Anaerolineales bacterium]
MEPLKIVYIAGSGRTGSTILGQLLDMVDGVFFGGELIDFWQRGLLENRLCGCGLVASHCQVWGEVVRFTAHEVGSAAAQAMVRARANATVRDLVPSKAEALVAYPEWYVQNSRLLYRTIQRVTGSQIIVDSSKFTHYAKVLVAMDTVDLHLVHLVRDPRAVAYSWSKKKHFPDPSGTLAVPQFGPIGSTVRWIVRNRSAKALGRTLGSRYYLLRYEDYIREPSAYLEPILEQLGLTHAHRWAAGPNQLSLPTSHALWGNPSRFLSGEAILSPDEAWRTRLPRWKQRLVAALAAPWLAEYGYDRKS